MVLKVGLTALGGHSEAVDSCSQGACVVETDEGRGQDMSRRMIG